MGGCARARRVCERAAAASIALLGAACLNDLDPSIAANLCRGNLTDGALDAGEECDDGNDDGGDGCDRGCRVECPAGAFKDPANAHCYLPARARSFGEADDVCRGRGPLPTRPLTVRSAREAAFVRDVVYADRPPGAKPLVRTAYAFGRATTPFTFRPASGAAPVEATLSFRQAAPSAFRAEPGLLAYYTVAVPPVAAARPPGELRCSGCFGPVDGGDGAGAGGAGSDGEAWWGPATVAPDAVPPKGLAFDPNRGAFVPVDLDRPDEPGAFETLCERVPDSPPRNEGCAAGGAACAGAPSLRFTLGGSLYAYFDEALDGVAAAARCAGLGATLWIIDDEDERERVVRLLAAASAPFARGWPAPARWGAWVGVVRAPGGGTWAWADGAPASADRPVPWALEPAEGSDAACGYVVLRGDAFERTEAAPSEAFALGLVVATPCAPAAPPGEPAHPGVLCEQPAPR
jgi:cysteine-rich repeat protein